MLTLLRSSLLDPGSKRARGIEICALVVASLFPTIAAHGQAPFSAQLKALPFQIVYETYTNNNWEIFFSKRTQIRFRGMKLFICALLGVKCIHWQ